MYLNLFHFHLYKDEINTIYLNFTRWLHDGVNYFM